MDLIGVGVSTLDFLLRAPLIKKVHKGYNLIDFNIQGGSMVAITMVTLAELRVNIGIITSVRDDNYGNYILRDLASEGIDVSYSKVIKGCSSVLVDHDYIAKAKNLTH